MTVHFTNEFTTWFFETEHSLATQYLIQFSVIFLGYGGNINSNFVNWAKIIYKPFGLAFLIQVGIKKMWKVNSTNETLSPMEYRDIESVLLAEVPSCLPAPPTGWAGWAGCRASPPRLLPRPHPLSHSWKPCCSPSLIRCLGHFGGRGDSEGGDERQTMLYILVTWPNARTRRLGQWPHHS